MVIFGIALYHGYIYTDEMVTVYSPKNKLGEVIVYSSGLSHWRHSYTRKTALNTEALRV